MRYLFFVKIIAVATTSSLVCLASFSQTNKVTDAWKHLPAATLPTFKTDTFNIVRFGAKADGTTLNTKTIDDAITACSRSGGGVVRVPAGVWLTGPVKLKDGVNLHIDLSAILLFTADKSQYGLIEGQFEGHPSPRNESPISGTGLINIAITGEGIIDANGASWRQMNKDKVTESEWNKLVLSGGGVSANGKTWYPSEQFKKGATLKESFFESNLNLDAYRAYKDFFRPNLLVLTNCNRILLEGCTFQNSPAWCIHPLLSSNITLRNVHVRNAWNAQNGDGIDFESCRNVLMDGCTIDAGDDGICIKSGRGQAGRLRATPTQDVVVKNCTVYRAHGGFVIGSEMSGGAKNLFVSNCSFIDTDIGLRFKTTRGRGGVVENVYVKDIFMKNIAGSAILFDMFYGGKSPLESDDASDTTIHPVSQGTPQFKNFFIDRLVCLGASDALLARGLPELFIHGIYLNDIIFDTRRGITLKNAWGVSLQNIAVNAEDKKLVVADNTYDLRIDSLRSNSASKTLLTVKGQKSNHITLSHAGKITLGKDVILEQNVDKKSVNYRDWAKPK